MAPLGLIVRSRVRNLHFNCDARYGLHHCRYVVSEDWWRQFLAWGKEKTSLPPGPIDNANLRGVQSRVQHYTMQYTATTCVF